MLNILSLLALSLALIYIGACVFALLFANSMIFPAPPASYEDDESIIKLQSSSGDTISLVYLNAGPEAPLLLYSHGNGEDLGHILPLLKVFQSKGVSVLAYDYPGYGTSSGVPSEAGSYAAIDTAYRYALESLQYASERIILYGRSLGSGPSTWLAEHYEVAGLILDGAFSSTFRVITRIKLLPFDRFDNVARLKNMKTPLLIMHGAQDRVVPFSHAQYNARVAGDLATTIWVEEAGHNDLIDILGETYWQRTIDFIFDNSTNEHHRTSPTTP